MDAPALNTALARLHYLAEQHPGLAPAVAFYRHLIPVQSAASACIPPMSLSSEALETRLATGVPLLLDEPIDFNVGECYGGSRSIFIAIAQAAEKAAVETTGPHLTLSAAGAILDALETDDLDPLPLISAAECDDPAPVVDAAARLGLDPRLLQLLAENTLKAFLRAWRGGVEKQLAAAGLSLEAWQRSQCPFCGSPPALAEMQGVEGARHLRCLRCGADWPYPNLTCASCGNDDFHSLGLIQVDGEAMKQYIHTCDICRRYIKTIVTYDPTPVDLLIVEDLATLHLDQIAADRGYDKAV